MNHDRIEAAAQWGVISVLVALGLVYAGDYLYVRMKLGAGAEANAGNGILGSVTLQRYWEIPQKNGKVEYSFDPPAQQTCVHSIFSHAGYSPCWYLSRRKMVRMSSSIVCGDQESLQAAERTPARSTEAGSVPNV